MIIRSLASPCCSLPLRSSMMAALYTATFLSVSARVRSVMSWFYNYRTLFFSVCSFRMNLYYTIDWFSLCCLSCYYSAIFSYYARLSLPYKAATFPSNSSLKWFDRECTTSLLFADYISVKFSLSICTVSVKLLISIWYLWHCICISSSWTS